MSRVSFPSDALQSILELQDSSLPTLDKESITDHRTTYPFQDMPGVGADDLALHNSQSAPQAPFIPGGAAAITSQQVHLELSATPTHDSSSALSADGLASNMPDSPDHGMPPACAAARQPARPGRRAARSSAGSFTPTSSGRRRRRRSLSPDPMVTTSGLLAAEMPSAEETHTCKKQKCKAATTPTSKYAGVTWHKGNKKFRATIYYLQHDKAKPKHLGYSESDLEAARWYDEVTLVVRTKPKTNFAASNYASKEELRAKWEEELGPLPVPDRR
ncbi:hypothetical protein WJX75_002358 [Coccomyxa subellipsoidea]|uniref:AP2/ERF domain-containing protein n=1 Tax=Coccomyxa subellipsoidea TaxID=248742 RepID=A0ABR2YBF4_9CHLO